MTLDSRQNSARATVTGSNSQLTVEDVTLTGDASNLIVKDSAKAVIDDLTTINVGDLISSDQGITVSGDANYLSPDGALTVTQGQFTVKNLSGVTTVTGPAAFFDTVLVNPGETQTAGVLVDSTGVIPGDVPSYAKLTANTITLDGQGEGGFTVQNKGVVTVNDLIARGSLFLDIEVDSDASLTVNNSLMIENSQLIARGGASVNVDGAMEVKSGGADGIAGLALQIADTELSAKRLTFNGTSGESSIVRGDVTDQARLTVENQISLTQAVLALDQQAALSGDNATGTYADLTADHAALTLSSGSTALVESAVFGSTNPDKKSFLTVLGNNSEMSTIGGLTAGVGGQAEILVQDGRLDVGANLMRGSEGLMRVTGQGFVESNTGTVLSVNPGPAQQINVLGQTLPGPGVMIDPSSRWTVNAQLTIGGASQGHAPGASPHFSSGFCQ